MKRRRQQQQQQQQQQQHIIKATGRSIKKTMFIDREISTKNNFKVMEKNSFCEMYKTKQDIQMYIERKYRERDPLHTQEDRDLFWLNLIHALTCGCDMDIEVEMTILTFDLFTIGTTTKREEWRIRQLLQKYNVDRKMFDSLVNYWQFSMTTVIDDNCLKSNVFNNPYLKQGPPTLYNLIENNNDKELPLDDLDDVCHYIPSSLFYRGGEKCYIGGSHLDNNNIRSNPMTRKGGVAYYNFVSPLLLISIPSWIRRLELPRWYLDLKEEDNTKRFNQIFEKYCQVDGGGICFIEKFLICYTIEDKKWKDATQIKNRDTHMVRTCPLPIRKIINPYIKKAKAIRKVVTLSRSLLSLCYT